MTSPPARKWPRLAALAYALFGLILFGLSTIKPVRGDGSENAVYDTILRYSYPCASYGACLNFTDIPFNTGILLMEYTPLGSYKSEKFLEDGFEIKYPFFSFFFTKNYFTMSPDLWLLIILYGCLFYYCATWLLVKGVAFFRQRG
jgi:hypothetical protein